MIINYRQAVPMVDTGPDINFIEYIESSNTQYIDTGFKPNHNTRVVAEIQCTAINPAWQAVFGCRSSSQAIVYAVYMDPSGKFRSDYNDNILFSPNLNSLGKYTIDKNKDVCMIGGETVTNKAGQFQLTNNMMLFAAAEGSGVKFHAYMRLYSCQIFDNNVLIRDYAPAIDPYDVACLYDKVSEEYVYNAGSGLFIIPS